MSIQFNVLFVARVFPPQSGSAVQRPAKFVKYLKRYGWLSHVVTRKSGIEHEDPSLKDDIPSDTPVHRVGSLEPDYLRGRIAQRSKFPNARKSLLHFILRVYAAGYHRLAVPDASVGWVPFALIKAVKVMRSKPIDVVYVHGQPPSSFLVGWLLKNIFNMPLVLDYDDPWSTSPNYSPAAGLKKKMNRHFEKRCLQASDLVVICKEVIAEELKSSFAAAATLRMRYIPNGYDEADFSVRALPKEKDKFRMVYTGKLDGKFCYSPETFFRALNDLVRNGTFSSDEFEVLLAGSLANDYRQMIQEMKLGAFIKHLGYLNHKDAVALLKSADAFLLIIESAKGRSVSEAFSGSVPAKLYEYLYLNKPILAVIPPGPEREILRRCGDHCIAAPNDRQSVKQALSRVFKHRFYKRDTLKPNKCLIQRFDRRRLTGQLAAAFNELVNASEATTAAQSQAPVSAGSDGAPPQASGTG